MEFISDQKCLKINIENKERFKSKLYKVEYTVTTRFNIYNSEFYVVAISIANATKYANAIIDDFEDKHDVPEIKSIKEISGIEFNNSIVYTVPIYNKSKEIV